MAAVYVEPQRETPVVEEADVVVCGGGPAGVSAAIAAARAGAKTRLIELHGCLGGIWTSGLLSWIIDARGKPGFIQDLYRELERRGAAASRPAQDPKDVETFRDFACDPESLKGVLDDLCAAAGVLVRLHTRVVGAAVKDGKLDLAITESTSGREAWRGKVFIDATGNGDLADRAGCKWDYGREDGHAQPMSLIAVLAGARFGDIRTFVGGGWTPDSKKNLLAEMKRAGFEPSYHDPVLFRVYDDLFILMSNHEYRVSGLNADDVTRATLDARKEVQMQVAKLRSLGNDRWNDLRLVATGAQIGIREGRRIHGLYRVTVEDLVKGARFDDAVCRVTFGIDVHSPNPDKSKGYDHGGKRAQPYDIPYRALIAQDVNGLLMAGRCISGDFLAHSSYRVTGNAVALGEAAGVAAAVASISSRLPQEVPWPAIAEALGKLRATQPAGD
jgi:hypothetical protein